MNFLLDTNIILAYLRESKLAARIDEQIESFSSTNRAFVSVVTLAETKTIALMNGWGKRRTDRMIEFFTQEIPVIDINYQTIIDRYAEIDAYSKKKLAVEGEMLKGNARKMGKNDLWIAATASATDIHLITSDRDFDHLDTLFLDLKFVDFSK